MATLGSRMRLSWRFGARFRWCCNLLLVAQNLVHQNLVRQNLVPIDFPNFDDDDNNDEEEHVESLRLGNAADATDLAGRSFLLLLLLLLPSSFSPSSPLTSPISTTTTTTRLSWGMWRAISVVL